MAINCIYYRKGHFHGWKYSFGWDWGQASWTVEGLINSNEGKFEGNTIGIIVWSNYKTYSSMCVAAVPSPSYSSHVTQIARPKLERKEDSKQGMEVGWDQFRPGWKRLPKQHDRVRAAVSGFQLPIQGNSFYLGFAYP